jgi:ATP-dependent DNA helicase RecQ
LLLDLGEHRIEPPALDQRSVQHDRRDLARTSNSSPGRTTPFSTSNTGTPGFVGPSYGQKTGPGREVPFRLASDLHLSYKSDMPASAPKRRAGSGQPSRLAVPRSRLEAACQQAAARLGIAELRPSQKRAIEASLEGRDVLMVLPTGFGKSACYQVPSMLLAQPTVVVSPLRALLRDQQQKLEKLAVPCIRLDGTLRGKARREALERIAEGGPILVMTTPETLESEDLNEVLQQTGIGLAAVDEAHCISEWGHDFRPAYSRIGTILKRLGSPPVLALTATATQRVRETIIKTLNVVDPDIVSASPHRSNLSFEVIPCEGDHRLRALMRLIKRLRRPGIIYCATRRETEAVYTVLKKFKIPSYRYHGKMTAKERDTEQKKFMRRNHRSIMVATNAFGLGIDKPDIRYILHYQAPASLEQYVQEAGRAGRDGHRANCLLLIDPKDRVIHEALLNRSRVRPDHLYRLGRTLGAWAAEGRSPSLQALAVSANLGPRIVAALLTKIEEAGFIERDEDEIRITVGADEIEPKTRGLAGQFETLRTQDARRLDSLTEYATVEGCRAAFLSAYFGEEPEGDCGLCDNCQERKPRSAGFFAPIKAPESVRRQRAGRNRSGPGQKRKRRRKRPGAGPQADKPNKPAAATTEEGAPKRRRRRRRRRRKPKQATAAAAPAAE